MGSWLVWKSSLKRGHWRAFLDCLLKALSSPGRSLSLGLKFLQDAIVWIFTIGSSTQTMNPKISGTKSVIVPLTVDLQLIDSHFLDLCSNTCAKMKKNLNFLKKNKFSLRKEWQNCEMWYTSRRYKDISGRWVSYILVRNNDFYDRIFSKPLFVFRSSLSYSSVTKEIS